MSIHLLDLKLGINLVNLPAIREKFVTFIWNYLLFMFIYFIQFTFLDLSIVLVLAKRLC